MIDKLVTQDLQPRASRAFCDSVGERSRLMWVLSTYRVWFASYENSTEAQMNACACVHVVKACLTEETVPCCSAPRTAHFLPLLFPFPTSERVWACLRYVCGGREGKWATWWKKVALFPFLCVPRERPAAFHLSEAVPVARYAPLSCRRSVVCISRIPCGEGEGGDVQRVVVSSEESQHSLERLESKKSRHFHCGMAFPLWLYYVHFRLRLINAFK